MSLRAKRRNPPGRDGRYTAELDEAFFPVEGLLNFSAIVTTEANKACLHLEVKGTENVGSNLAPAIHQALESVPAIRLARQSNQLDLTLTVDAGDTISLSGLAKRTIYDRRALS